MAVLHSCTASGELAHLEANAIYVAAYGEPVLRNAGDGRYNSGIVVDGGMITWDHIHNSAFSGSTVVVEGRNHTSRIGGDRRESLLDAVLDYGCGS